MTESVNPGVPQSLGARRIIIGSKHMGLPDINIKTNSTNFNTIQPKSRNHGHARAASMLDNYPSQNMGNHQGMQNNLMTPGLNRKLSQGSIESQGSLAQLHRNDSRSPEKFGGSQ